MKYFFCAILCIFQVSLASAHSKINETLPADGAVLDTVPQEIILRFDNSIRLVTINLMHDDDHIEVLDMGEQTAFGKEFFLPVTSLGSGQYMIDWRGLGEDGHVMQGQFGFVVE